MHWVSRETNELLEGLYARRGFTNWKIRSRMTTDAISAVSSKRITFARTNRRQIVIKDAQ